MEVEVYLGCFTRYQLQIERCRVVTTPGFQAGLGGHQVNRTRSNWDFFLEWCPLTARMEKFSPFFSPLFQALRQRAMFGQHAGQTGYRLFSGKQRFEAKSAPAPQSPLISCIFLCSRQLRSHSAIKIWILIPMPHSLFKVKKQAQTQELSLVLHSWLLHLHKKWNIINVSHAQSIAEHLFPHHPARLSINLCSAVARADKPPKWWISCDQSRRQTFGWHASKAKGVASAGGREGGEMAIWALPYKFA